VRKPCGSVGAVEAERADRAAAPEPSSEPSPAAASAPAHRWGLGAFLLVAVVYVVASVALAFALAGVGRLSVGAVLLAVAAPTVIAAGLAVLITRLRGNGPRTDLGLRWSWRGLRLGLAFGFGGLLVTVPVTLFYVSIVRSPVDSAIGRVFGGVRASWPWAVAVFLIVALLAPLCEEIIFRGLLWGAIDRRWGRWVALAVTTVVFALAHFEFTRAPVLVLVAIPIGLARLYSGGLLASIVAHQVNNLLPAIALMLALVGVTPSP
jgi:uncharacterized protein